MRFHGCLWKVRMAAHRLLKGSCVEAVMFLSPRIYQHAGATTVDG